MKELEITKNQAFGIAEMMISDAVRNMSPMTYTIKQRIKELYFDRLAPEVKKIWEQAQGDKNLMSVIKKSNTLGFHFRNTYKTVFSNDEGEVFPVIDPFHDAYIHLTQEEYDSMRIGLMAYITIRELKEPIVVLLGLCKTEDDVRRLIPEAARHLNIDVTQDDLERSPLRIGQRIKELENLKI